MALRVVSRPGGSLVRGLRVDPGGGGGIRAPDRGAAVRGLPRYHRGGGDRTLLRPAHPWRDRRGGGPPGGPHLGPGDDGRPRGAVLHGAFHRPHPGGAGRGPRRRLSLPATEWVAPERAASAARRTA